MRARRLLLLLALAIAALLPGCGAEFKLPTESKKPGVFPGDGTYQRIQTWTGMEGVSDIVLTQGSGSQLFIVFKAGVGRPPRVVEYPLTRDEPLPFQITDLINPVAACFAKNHLFVLDQGDTGAARITRPTYYQAPCDSLMQGFTRPIADLSKYWRVREYDIVTGDTISTFTDTTLAWVNGIAADGNGRVYVSGVLIHCDVDPFDSRLRTLDHEFRIYRYEPGGPDPDMPGAAWQRDRGYELVQGTGIGSTIDPNQMYWDGLGGAALYFADRGNNEIQKFGDPGGGGSSYKIDDANDTTLVKPTDVALDRLGFVYLVDAGNRRVLRYDENGQYVQRIDLDASAPAPSLASPLALAADDSLVYVGDPGRGQVIRFKRRK